MIDLHLHLDGSLSIEDYEFLAKKNNVILPNDFPNSIHVNSDCKSLKEYLEKFDLPLKLLQDPVSLAYASKSLVTRLYKLGYIYAEIRFAPLLHTSQGMTQNEAVISAISGLESALKDTPGFNANLILCCMKQAPMDENKETIELAKKFKNNRVVAVDIAGPESFRSFDEFHSLFLDAKKNNLNITIHAGEACGSGSVITAIDNCYANRIGHGIHLELSRCNILKVITNNIGFEFCPTSNLQTKSLNSYKELPLSEFLRYGIKVSINSDNMTVSNTNVYKEYAHLMKTFNLSNYELQLLLFNAVDCSFAPINEKIELKNKILCRFNLFIENIM